jgi:hypothetical protein
MLTTLALVAALGLAPSQGGKLDLTNVRPTYGVLGVPRPDTKFLPGDEFFLCYDIENLKVSDDGKVSYGMAIEATDAKGKVWFKDAQDKLTAINYFGGNRLPAFAYLEINQDQPAGQYTLKVTVTDNATKASKELTHKFEVLSPGFGMVRLKTTYDGRLPCPMMGVPGQGMSVQWVCVGFERDSKKQPHISVETRILDEAGKPTLAKPFPGEVTEAMEKQRAVDMSFGMFLSRPGKFTVDIKATDNVSKKTATTRFPLTVLDNDAKATPAQAGKLDLTNARPTYGVFGVTRPDTKYLPGDTFFLGYDIDNLKMTEVGVIYYGVATEVTDGKGKVVSKEDKAQAKITVVNHLGGNRLPASAYWSVPLDALPGEYTLKVTVIDRAAKASKELTHKFEVLPPAFGLVGLTTSYDPDDRLPSPMLGVPGQGINIHWGAVGFERDKVKKQPKLSFEIRTLDDGKPTLGKPFIAEVTEVPDKMDYRGFGMLLNRPGKFAVEISAVDSLTKKKATLKFPLTILPNDVKAK